MALILIVSTPAGAERRFEVHRGRPCRIGRAADNEIVLEDQSVSSHHAAVDASAGAFRIADLRSRNGTAVNRRPLGPGGTSPLRPGDEVRVGQCVLRVEAADVHAVETQAEDEPLSERVSPSSAAIPRLPPPAAAANAAVQALFGRGGEDSTALLPQSPEARDLSLRAYALRQSLNALAADGPFDAKSQALPERLKEFIDILGDEAAFAGGGAELDAVLAASFPVEAAAQEGGLRRLASDLAALAMRAFAPAGAESSYWNAWRDAQARAGVADGREPTCLHDRDAPILIQHTGFGDALRRQGLALMANILVRLGHDPEPRIREAIARGAAAPASPAMLLDLQVYQLRGGVPLVDGEDEGGLVDAVRHWAATDTLCEHLFRHWNWLVRSDLSMPRRADEIVAVREGGGALHGEWKDGLAPDRVAVPAGIRGGMLAFDDVRIAVVGADPARGSLLAAASAELARGDDARLHVAPTATGAQSAFAVGGGRGASRMGVRTVALDDAHPRGALFVADACELKRESSRVVAELRAFRERHPALRHVPVGLVLANADAALGEHLRALPRPYLIPDTVSLAVVQAGIALRHLPETAFDRLRLAVVEDLALNRHPAIQRFVADVLREFRPFFEELISFTYRHQTFVAASPAGRESFGASEPVRWMAAKLWGPFLRQGRAAVLADIDRIETARARMKAIGEHAARLRAAEARRAEVETRIAKLPFPLPGMKGKLEAALQEERLAERELRALLPVAEELAGISAAEGAARDERLRRLEARLAELAAAAGDLVGQAAELDDLYKAFHPFGMTSLYWA